MIEYEIPTATDPASSGLPISREGVELDSGGEYSDAC